MEQIMEYIQPELLILIPVLYFVGIGLKRTSLIADKTLPIILGLSGIVLSTIYVLATNDLESWKDFLFAGFTSIAQGVLVAGCSVYFNQILKQARKSEEDGNKNTEE